MNRRLWLATQFDQTKNYKVEDILVQHKYHGSLLRGLQCAIQPMLLRVIESLLTRKETLQLSCHQHFSWWTGSLLEVLPFSATRRLQMAFHAQNLCSQGAGGLIPYPKLCPYQSLCFGMGSCSTICWGNCPAAHCHCALDVRWYEFDGDPFFAPSCVNCCANCCMCWLPLLSVFLTFL